MKTTIALSVLTLVCVSGSLATHGTGSGQPGATPSFIPTGSTAIAGEPEQSCDGKTIGFWGNPNGEALIEAGNFLEVLPSLHLVDELGMPFVTHDFDVFEDWLQHANAVNMAYMLSAQLVAMQFNVMSGKVDERCVMRTPLGEMPVNRLIQLAIQALIKDGYTPPGDHNRRRQEILKDLLDAANNNQIWSA